MVAANKLVSAEEKDPDVDEEDGCILFKHDDMNDTCMAHSLQLCIKNVLKKNKPIKEVVNRQLNIAKVFRKSTPYWNALRAEQLNKLKNDTSTCNKRPIRPQVFAEVRWNSVKHLLGRNLYLRTFYQSLMTSDIDNAVAEDLQNNIGGEEGYPETTDWDVVKEMHEVLKNLR